MVSGIGYLYNQGFGGFVLPEKHGIFFLSLLNLYCRAILNFECWSSQTKPMSELRYPCLTHIKKFIKVHFFPVKGWGGISVLMPALLEPCSSDQFISPYSSLDETSLIFI